MEGVVASTSEWECVVASTSEWECVEGVWVWRGVIDTLSLVCL